MENTLIITSSHPIIKVIEGLERKISEAIHEEVNSNRRDILDSVLEKANTELNEIFEEYLCKIKSLHSNQKEDYYNLIRPSYASFDNKYQSISTLFHHFDGKSDPEYNIIYSTQMELLEEFSNKIRAILPDFESEDESNINNLLDEIDDVESVSEQIRLIYELGILDHLKKQYPDTLGKSNNALAGLIAKFLNSSKNVKIPTTTIQPIVNALIKDDASSKNYPKKSPRIKVIIESLKID